MSFLVGEPDNLSVVDLLDVLKSEYPDSDLPALVSPDNLDAIRATIELRALKRIRTCAVSEVADEEVKKKRIHFMSGRYTFDAEILSRLIHCRRPNPKRPFPKGLDVLVVLGSETAEGLLLNEYNEQLSWPPFSDTLRFLQQEYAAFKYWNKNAYNRRMDLLLTLDHSNERSPYYMHLDAWTTRTLTTALAGWTQLKHEVVLYAKQPLAAQCGGRVSGICAAVGEDAICPC